MKECVITKRIECPHDNISGEKCSPCKIPDNHFKTKLIRSFGWLIDTNENGKETNHAKQNR